MADTQPPSDDSPWYETFDAVFWLTISGSFFAFMAVVLRACLKSRCTSISCCGLECQRDLSQPVNTDDIKLNIEPARPSASTPRSMSDFGDLQEGN
jgi:hypothetical protein